MQCLHILFKVTDSFQHPPWYDYITTSSYRIFEIVLLSITRSNRIDQNNNEKDKKKHILHCVSLSRHRVSLDVSTRIWFFITVTICGFFSFSLPSTSIEVWCILTLVIFMNTKDHWARKKAGTNEQNKKINKQTQFYIYIADWREEISITNSPRIFSIHDLDIDIVFWCDVDDDVLVQH